VARLHQPVLDELGSRGLIDWFRVVVEVLLCNMPR
jgi:hypothetical protein